MLKPLISGIALLTALTACATLPEAHSEAPKPLFRDPVYDGAADVAVVYDTGEKHWKMFYTNRRANLKPESEGDVSWVHGTKIGIATSEDGLNWAYAGEANIPPACTGETLWAPEIFTENGVHHLFITVVPGVFNNWNAPRKIVHLSSTDLQNWTCEGPVDLGSERVIDAGVYKLGDTYRMWFKDERQQSRLFAADSKDLKTWTRHEKPVADIGSEGPKVFEFNGYYWLIADAWKGLIVLRSTDAENWELQPDRILEAPGQYPTDNFKGQHPDILINDGKAFIYYFVHQHAAPEVASDPYWGQRTVIQLGELVYKDGWLRIDRNAPVTTPLKAPE
ncbi:family 43 glycosylhydrolase [Asticcacaulis tiandongensis]|uniref:family 43 glycosylhydrolase n=1 Tax=Asticcacaulis tiandongensis TaxID=2565365 RepID=UPI00112A4F04|nr:family 43 glycosylhydrolase [Asticcacaulis tiandongensis]